MVKDIDHHIVKKLLHTWHIVYNNYNFCAYFPLMKIKFAHQIIMIDTIIIGLKLNK